MFGLKPDWTLELPERYLTLENYEGGVARWCPGCGDHGVLAAVKRICRDEQIPTEKVVAVSGIGCASRFPHYMHAYGFHGLHGRAFPVACGIKARRPDLAVWVATGDGDCCSIGAGHWLHAIRYNMDMTVMLFDNNIYGLTKKQTSPTTPVGLATNTHPRGAWLPPLNVVETVLGFTNVSFVARTVDWNAQHLYDTLRAAYEHRGTSFVHILQRCPAYTAHIFEEARNDPDRVALLEHEHGVPIDAAVARVFANRRPHDPADLAGARALAGESEKILLGLFYRNPDAPGYEAFTYEGLDTPPERRIVAVEAELDRFAI
ncbi:MAG TPA: thiamine pyrophosphate-dependent enzyme [Thermoanaerobaculia bacterium]|nr:thiamine pyrophosphate-dependent enzyme [Thermoanaerobaculia bacterium]